MRDELRLDPSSDQERQKTIANILASRLPGGRQRRRYPRFPSAKDALITMGARGRLRTMRGRIIEFSEVGARLVVDDDKGTIGMGETLKVRWSPHSHNDQMNSPELPCEMMATVRTKEGKEGDSMTYGLSFHRTIDEGAKESAGWYGQKAALGAAITVAVVICCIKAASFMNASHIFFKIYSILAGLFFFSRVLISRYYKEPVDQGYLPKVSIVIAAKNEEDCIEPTVMHCLRSRYPQELLEIIAIDDGSTDRTWDVLQQVKKRYPSLTTIKFEKNLGKRHGMAAGARVATGEVLIYVDSDSFIEPEAVYRIVQAFKDEEIGAVAGHTMVLLEEGNFFSKMESVRYYISHRVLKAAESVYGAVTCCPGAFSAYRRSTVMNILDRWLNQKFLGVQATFGDDRSLTNFVLRTHKVIFHNGARCVTKVPSKWMIYFKQQLRWKKSWCRETFNACRLMWRMHPVASLAYYVGVILTLSSPIVVLRSLIYMPIITGSNPLFYLAGLLLSYVLLGLMCHYYTPTPYWFHGVYFAMLYLGVLCWQNYYALLTINKTAWGTR